MKLSKKSAGSVGVHVWAKPGDTVEVPDDLGQELLTIAKDEFSHVADEVKAVARAAKKAAAKPVEADATVKVEADASVNGK